MELTQKQKKLLRYMKEYKLRNQETPSLRQCAADLGVSHAAIAQMIKILEQKEVIRRHGRYGRQISIRKDPELENHPPGIPVPIVGEIAAGLPLYAQKQWAGSVVVDPQTFSGRNLFALTIRGDSMKDAAILDGDIVICKPRQFAENGEIVAALVGNEEATVKRFFKTDDSIELRPENPDFSSQFYSFDDVLIQGAVIGVIRNL